MIADVGLALFEYTKNITPGLWARTYKIKEDTVLTSNMKEFLEIDNIISANKT